MSNEPEPQVGSQMRAPGLLFVSFANNVETSAGVKNSPAFFPASLAKFEIKYIYASPIMSLFSRCVSSRFNSLKSINRFFRRAFFSLGSPRFALLKLMFLKMLLPSSLLIFSWLASSRSARAISISSPMLSSDLCWYR